MKLQELLTEAKNLNNQEKIQLAMQLLQWLDMNINPDTKMTPEKKVRQPGLNPGSCIFGDDFDQPLPDDFWLGES
jgi:hypothetical protein